MHVCYVFTYLGVCVCAELWMLLSLRILLCVYLPRGTGMSLDILQQQLAIYFLSPLIIR